MAICDTSQHLLSHRRSALVVNKFHFLYIFFFPALILCSYRLWNAYIDLIWD